MRIACTLSLVVVGALAGAATARAATITIVNDDARNTSLRDAIIAANLTAEADVIVLPGKAAPTDPPTRFDFGAAQESDPAAGAVVLQAITSDITIEGPSPNADEVILSGGIVDGCMFVVRTDPTLAIDGGLELPAKLTLKNLTVELGNCDGGGAVTITAAPPPTGELPRFAANTVVFSENTGLAAGAILNLGGPLDVRNSAFLENGAPDHTSAVGAVSSTSGGVIASTVFDSNQGNVGAVEVAVISYVNDLAATVPTVLQLSGCDFTANSGIVAGAVHTVADTGLGNSDFIDNTSDGDGGGVVANNIAVAGGVFENNRAAGNGGAIALIADVNSAPSTIAFADFSLNVSNGNGAAIASTGLDLTFTDGQVARNLTAGNGGGLYVNGGTLLVERIAFSLNIARPNLFLGTGDNTLDELGEDSGKIVLTALGNGSGLYVETATDVQVHESCFVNNANFAARVVTATALDMNGCFWGSDDGPGPNGTGDTVLMPNGVADPTAVATPPAICDPPNESVDNIEVPIDVRADGTATINTDYRVVREGTTITLVTADDDVVLIPQRTGALTLEVVGVNDADPEDNETLTIEVPFCQGGLGSCGEYFSAGTLTSNLTITDNGDGIIPGGEGEGETECVEGLRLSAKSLTFDPVSEDSGDKASEQTLTVTNTSTCSVQLVPPLVRKGASNGFDVSTVLQKDLLLESGDSITMTVSYLKPKTEEPAEEPIDGEGEPAEPVAVSGELVIETQLGTRATVKLVLAEGCGCSTSGAPAPQGAALVLLASMIALRLGRRRDQRAR